MSLKKNKKKIKKKTFVAVYVHLTQRKKSKKLLNAKACVFLGGETLRRKKRLRNLSLFLFSPSSSFRSRLLDLLISVSELLSLLLLFLAKTEKRGKGEKRGEGEKKAQRERNREMKKKRKTLLACCSSASLMC